MLLFDLPDAKTFGPGLGNRATLRDWLEESYRNTNVCVPASVRDVRLDVKTLRTQAGYRYSAAAFRRICRLLAPGLSKVVLNVLGEGAERDKLREIFSRESACHLFNEVADLRFDGLVSGHQMLLDSKRQRIEGFLGPKTHYLENSSFLDLVETIITDCADVAFAGADITGRRLFIRYLNPKRIPTVQGNWLQGYAFCIDEAGDDAIRAYLYYQRVECGSGCLQPRANRQRQRQRRTGSKFAARLKQLLAGVLRAEPLDLATVFQELASRKLFHEGTEGALRHIQRQWVQVLRLAGIPADIADGVAGMPFMATSLFGQRTLPEVLRCTEYDLFYALIADASGRNQRLRELLERAAFSVFMKG